jgi:hypothetical protein
MISSCRSYKKSFQLHAFDKKQSIAALSLILSLAFTSCAEGDITSASLLYSSPVQKSVSEVSELTSIKLQMQGTRLVTVHMSGTGDTIRLKLPLTESETCGAIVANIRHALDKNTAINKVEFYNAISSKFEYCEESQEINPSNRLVSTYVHTGEDRSSSSNPASSMLMIRGRTFDTSDGLPVRGTYIRLTDRDIRTVGTGLNTWDGSVVLAKFLELQNLSGLNGKHNS